MANEFESITDVLRRRAVEHPSRRAFTFLGDGEKELAVMTFADLDRMAASRARLLLRVAHPGERALLLYPSGLEFICGLLACLYAGVIAVPAYPPRPNRLESRVHRVLADALATLALTTKALKNSVERQLADAPGGKGVIVIATDAQGTEGESAHDVNYHAHSGAPALLQYTSGSTSKPKGVIVTHQNLLHNELTIQRACDHDQDSTFVGWLPMYHDMGLIGNVFQPLFIGAHCVLMSPVAFLQKPSRWLNAITHYRGVTSGGPNFGYELCIRQISDQERIGLDLTSWRVAFNGAEPVRADTMTRFVEAFSSHGFRANAFYPCYGLAESTLMVSGGRPVEAPVFRNFAAASLMKNSVQESAQSENSITLVGCGRALLDSEIRIVNPQTGEPCGARDVGEIWVSGPSVSPGYWKHSEETAKTFIHLDGRRFLRTGDMGFLHCGELFVTGRIKDLIIIRGRNYYPQDLEVTAERSHPALRPGCGAAFTVEQESETKLVLVYEMEHSHTKEPDDVADAIRRAVADEFGLSVYAVQLIQRGTIPKTTSGKIRRDACRSAFLTGSLQVLVNNRLPPAAVDMLEAANSQKRPAQETPDQKVPVKSDLAVIVSQVLKIDPRLCARHSLVSLGVDSLSATEMQYRIETQMGIRVSAVEILEAESVEALASRLAANPVSLSVQEPLDAVDYQSASIEQRRLWLLERMTQGGADLCITASFKLAGDLRVEILERALQSVLARHKILRTIYEDTNGRVIGRLASEVRLPLTSVDFRGVDSHAQSSMLRKFAEQQTAAPFDLGYPPLVRAGLAQLSDREWSLVITMHHLISDARSLEIFARNTMEEYGALLGEGVLSRTEERFQYADFAEWQSRRISEGVGANSIAYWKQRLHSLPDLRFPFELTSRNAAKQPKRIPFGFSDLGVDSLRECANRENVTVFMFLIAVFQLLLHRLSGQEEVVTAFPVHGRTLAACKNLIGFFAYPVLLRSDCSGDPSFRQLLCRVRADVFEAMQHGDLPFATTVGLATAKNPRAPLFRTLFSYVQSELSGLEAANVVLSPTRLTIGTGDCDLALTVCAVDGLSSGELTYNASFFDDQTARWIASSYAYLLKQCITSSSARLSEFLLSSHPAGDSTEGKPKDAHIRIMATFTAEPVLESLMFWMEQIGVTADIDFAPHNQIFQQLLLKTEEPNYLKSFDVILIRQEDWQGSNGDVHDPITRLAAVAQIEENLKDFLTTLEQSIQRGSQQLVIFCPGSTDLISNPALIEKENATLKALASIDGVRALGSNAVLARYPVASYYDQKSDRTARIPYTEAFFAALGTVIAREIYSITRIPRKVIAVDCDGTLWDGLCGEDGPEGVLLTLSARALQEFLCAQHAAGMLICLCSKNEEKDVLQTLTARVDMPLRPEHIIATRINWRSKHENLVALSKELNVGLETFIFIDDDEMQCAEVNAVLPEVLTVTMSQILARNLTKLRNIWDFDASLVTPAAKRRTELYKQEFERQHARDISRSLREFLEGLDLKVRIARAGPTSIERISELTRRTTQFNVSGIRRSSNQVKQGIASGDFECLTVQVQDRFGDYGEVGVIIYSVDGTALNVDTFLLSCRALGRGVEHKMLAHLAAVGQERGLEEVRINYQPSDRNKPALAFLQEAKRRLSDGDRSPVYRFPIASTVSFSYDHRDGAATLGESHTPQKGSSRPLSSTWNINTLAGTTCELSDPISLIEELRRRRVAQQDRGRGSNCVAPRTAIEAKLASMWCEMLGLDRVGVEDDFFELGGNSVIATQVLSRVWNEFGVEVPLAEFFERSFSVAQLARLIDACRVHQASADELERHLTEIETMSDDEVKLRLRRERPFESGHKKPPTGYPVNQ